jgi:hypothetical protein
MAAHVRSAHQRSAMAKTITAITKSIPAISAVKTNTAARASVQTSLSILKIVELVTQSVDLTKAVVTAIAVPQINNGVDPQINVLMFRLILRIAEHVAISVKNRSIAIMANAVLKALNGVSKPKSALISTHPSITAVNAATNAPVGICA